MLRHIAPAGAPIGVRDLAASARRLATDAEPLRSLHDAVVQRFGVRHAFSTCTGRAGLTVILRALRRLASPHRHEVILPSYTCFSVPASVVKAGLRPRLVDVDPATLDFDEAQLRAADFSRVLAVVATNLYGIPNDVPAWKRIATEHGAFLVDDAAQAMGATFAGQPSGTLGDVGLFSLDKGKTVSAIDGGIIVTNIDAIAAALDQEVRTLDAPSAGEVFGWSIKLAAYASLLRPELYWIPAGLPFLGLGRTVYTTEIALEALGPPAAALAVTMLGRLEAFTQARRSNAARLSALIAPVRGLSPVRPAPAADGAYVRLPVLAPDGAMRDRMIAALNAARIGATGSYPASLADVPDLQPHLANAGAPVTGGRDVAARIVTLPTHPWVAESDLFRMAATIEATLGSRVLLSMHRVAAR